MNRVKDMAIEFVIKHTLITFNVDPDDSSKLSNYLLT